MAEKAIKQKLEVQVIDFMLSIFLFPVWKLEY